jgi:predicted metal-binding membrane protein
VTIVSLVIGGVALAAMIAIAAYGWVTLPADARVPVHHGIGSYNNFVPKTAGLIIWPALGALIYAILAIASAGLLRHHPARATAPVIILPVVLVLAAAFEWGAIRAARRNSLGTPR